MNKKDFAKLCFNYSKEPNEDLYELWNYNLRCFDEEEMQKAINKIIATDKYFPTLNRLLEVVKEIVGNEDVYYKEPREIFRKKGVVPGWYGKEIKPTSGDSQEYKDFLMFLEKFRYE